MAKKVEKIVLEKIVKKAKEYSVKFELDAAVGNAVREIIGDEGHPSFGNYFATAIKRLRRDKKETDEARLLFLKADAIEVAIKARRDDLLGENDADSGLEGYQSQERYLGRTVRH